jgi:RNA-directed DNA polymerase
MVLTQDKTWRNMEKPALNSSLFDEILTDANVIEAWKQVRSNKGGPGIDHIRIEQFTDYLRPRWKRIKHALEQGYYIPLPVARVEIPKPSGGVRKLGIPTVLDRVIQQAIAQVLVGVLDPGFSSSSHGFRPGRSAHGAIRQLQGYVQEGYKFAVDVDIEKFFDNVNHDILMTELGRKVRDKRLLHLIGRYLRAGSRDKNGKFLASTVGTPQGGPLSPLLSNILLDIFDKHMERKGYRFARYCDDFVVLAQTKAEGDAILAEVSTFMKERLQLTVNALKSKVVPIKESAFLGFTFKGKKIMWTDKAFEKFKRRIRELTGRSWGVSMSYRLRKLSEYLRGWMNYFGISQFYSPIQDIDNWIRRRIRMCYWKQWRHIKTKIHKLKELGLPTQFAIITAVSSKSYWRLSKTYGTNAALSNDWLAQQGLVNVKALWCKAQGYTQPKKGKEFCSME